MQLVRNRIFPKVYEVDSFQKEFMSIIDEKFVWSPPFPRYQRWLIGSLRILESLGKEAIKYKNFEQLDNTNPKLYSIRYPKSKLNPRVLFVYWEPDKIILLAAFKEKRKSDYARNIKLAKERIKQLEV